MFFKKKQEAKQKLEFTELTYSSGSVIISYNTIAFVGNLSSINMKDYNIIKGKMLDIINHNSSLNIDLRTLTITNSAVIALITVIAKISRIELHKEIKFFIDSNLDWQTKLIKNVFKNAGPCDIVDANNTVTIESLSINYFRSESAN